MIPKINSLLKKGNSPALESFRNFVRKLFTDNEIYFDFKSLETYAQINKGILAEIIIEKLKTLRTAEKIKKLVEIVMKIEERSKKKGILQQFIFKIRQKIDKIPKPTSQKSKEKVIVWDEVFAYGMAISELYNNNIQCDLLRLWFQTIQSHAVIGVEPAKESIQYVFQNCEESMKKNDKRLFESCKYLSKAILNQKVVSHETKELAEGNSRSGDLCKKERVVKDFQSIDFHEKGVYSLDFESSMNKLKRGFHTRFDFNEYLDWNLDRYKTCALILFNYATEKGSRSKAFVDFVIRTTRFSKQNANFRKSVVTVTKEKFDDQVQQGNLNDETIVLLGELYNANFVSSLSMVEILEKFKTFSDTSKIEMIIDIIKGKVLNHKEQTLSLATMSLLSIVENYEKLNEENPQNLSNVQEKEMIVVMLMQFDASTDVSFIESLTPVKDLKTLEECSQVLVQKVIADCSLTEKCVRILGKILNFNDINSRDAVMDPIQIEFENVFVADVEIQLQKSTETAFSVINFIGKLNKAGIYTIKLNFCCLTTLFEAANTGNENCLRLFIVFLSETSGYFTEKKILPLEIFAFLLKQRDSRVVEAGKMKETANEGKKKQRKVADVLLNDLQEIIRRMENSWNDLKNVTVNESTEQVEKFEQVLNELNSKNFQEIMKKLEELEASSDDTSMREYAGMLVTKANMMPEVAQNVAAICLSLHEVLSPATKAERFRKHLEEAVDFVFDLCLSKTTKIHQGNNAVYFICHLRSGLIINKLKFVSYIEKLLQNRDTLLTVTTLITVLKTVDHKMISCEQLDNVHLRLKIESLGYDFKGAVKTEILQIIEKFERKKNNENKQAMDAKEWIEFLNGDDLTK